MSMLYGFGKTLVEADELHELKTSGRLQPFLTAARKSKSARLPVRCGVVETEGLMRTLTTAAGTRAAWTPIGIGKPLSIEIQHIYTGDFRGFWSARDLLCTSAMKPLDSFKAAPRAMNLLRKAAKKFQHIESPSAVEDGTVLVHHTPALTDGRLVLTVEMIADSFSQETFDTFSQALSSAAGIPVFASASAYMLAGSVVLKLLGELGEAIFDGSSFFQSSEVINFGRPPYTDQIAGQAVLINDQFKEEFQTQYDVREDGVLIGKAGRKPYDGPVPYVTLTLDGADVPQYKGFATTQATAELLSRFYHAGEKRPQAADTLLTAMKLYNDYDYRSKADEQAAFMKKNGKPDSEEYMRAKVLYDAYVKLIQEAAFKPKNS